MNTTELAAAYVAQFGPCTSVDSEWAGTAFSEAYKNHEDQDYDDFERELGAKVVRESIPKATEDQITEWKAALPDDLSFGTFEDDFKVEGAYYRYGAWNTAGDWWMAWNTDAEFQEQLAALD